MAFFVGAMIFAMTLVVSTKEKLVEKPSAFDYHRRIGIPLATEIKKQEKKSTDLFHTSKDGSNWTLSITHVPYQAVLVISLNDFTTSICSASLISQNRLLTAAHCKNDGKRFGVLFIVVLASNFVFSGGVRRTTWQVVAHPDYNYTNLRADIAVVCVSFIKFSKSIQPISFPAGKETNKDHAGWAAITSGFGSTVEDFENSRLYAVEVIVIRNVDCRRVFGQWIQYTTICTRNIGDKSTCNGDSGGPLVIRSDYNKTIQIGVRSFSTNKACTVGDPTAFARITSKVIDWIWSV